MIRDAYLGTGAVVVELLRHPAVAAGWERPSALPDLRVSGLAGHLSRGLTQVEKITGEPPATGVPIALLDNFWWLDQPRDHPDMVAVRDRGETTASGGPSALAETAAACLSRLRVTLPAEPPERVIELRDMWCLTLDDFLMTRLLELVVHLDDLAVSVDLPTPDVPAEASAAVIDLLARMATARHGPYPVIRAFSRRERAPETVAAF
ncbi:MAG: maleylpyruvate isomerase N-terminal domain-containing protein [Micromonosporaceae bacterium]